MLLPVMIGKRWALASPVAGSSSSACAYHDPLVVSGLPRKISRPRDHPLAYESSGRSYALSASGSLSARTRPSCNSRRRGSSIVSFGAPTTARMPRPSCEYAAATSSV
eukprot:6157655-Prymnesium_polylepis.1